MSCPLEGKHEIPALACHVQTESLDVDRPLQRVEQLRRDHLGLRGPHVEQQQPKLVSSQAGDRVASADRLLEAGRKRSQELVAVVVPERVVDLLEMVEVDEEDREGARLAPVSHDRLLDPVAEERAVGKTGQRVV